VAPAVAVMDVADSNTSNIMAGVFEEDALPLNLSQAVPDSVHLPLSDVEPMPLVSTNTSNINNFTVVEIGQTKAEITVTGYFMISLFLLVFGGCVLILVWSVERRRRQLIEAGHRFHPTVRPTKQRIQMRYETVEHWIISKTVQPHDAFCSAVVSNFCHHHHHQQQHGPTTRQDTDIETNAVLSLSDSPDSTECSSSRPEHVDQEISSVAPDASTIMLQPPPPKSSPVDLASSEAGGTDDGEESLSGSSPSLHHYDPSSSASEYGVRECPICMSELLVGHIVSWSANEQCSHGTWKVPTTIVQRRSSVILPLVQPVRFCSDAHFLVCLQCITMNASKSGCYGTLSAVCANKSICLSMKSGAKPRRQRSTS
jgi:hypothetical protein